MSFMMDIDAARPVPIDQLALDYFTSRSDTISFCRQVAAVAARTSEAEVAKRLGVSVDRVRGWRKVGVR